MKKLILAALAAATLAAAPAMAETTVTVTKFHQSYPYSGRATVEYTVGGTLPANAVAEITLRTDDASATFVQSNIVAGANTNVIDFASSFGGALVLTNASFTVTITSNSGGVQLWENGPYWAERNVGASSPEEYGYYFWWGDTVGYRCENGAWVASDGSTSDFSFNSGNTPTFGKDNATLQNDGWITADGVLAPEHDAAQTHWGGSWRMPTRQDLHDLRNKCVWTSTTQNGVKGCVVRGKGDFAANSIFLPYAGIGYETSLSYAGSYADYWSSVPNSDDGYSWSLYFHSRSRSESSFDRYYGCLVRPVRGFSSASGSVTYDSSTPYETWAAANGVAGAWDATDTLGVANVFCYVFNVPTGVFTNPPLLDIAIEGGNAVVITPPVSNTVGFAVSVVESSDVAGAAVTATKPLDATGRTVFPMGSAASRFYRLLATEGDASPGGVQLWANGPYWAECNVGASAPEEYGYYFWWGDTVGYTRSGGTWSGEDECWDGVTWVSSAGQQMDSSPFSSSSCPTFNKYNSTLQSEGWIDATGNLAAAHDAATAHLGASWRMPTDAEHGDLIDNCDWTWTTKNGVNGYEVRGRGDYASSSIFLPAAGYGNGSYLYSPGLSSQYWSSTPDSGRVPSYTWGISFSSGYFGRNRFNRYYGTSVRPVRDAD